MRYELKIALRYLRARRRYGFVSVTTVFTTVGVMIGVAALTVTLSVMAGFEASLQQRVLAFTPEVQIQSRGGSISNYTQIQAQVVEVPGVRASDAFLVGRSMMTSDKGLGGVIVRGVEPTNPAVAGRWGRYVVAGSLGSLGREPPQVPGGGESVLGTLAIGITLAARLKVKVGSRVRLVAPILTVTRGVLETKTGHFVVGAIFDSGISFTNQNLVFMELSHAQSFFGRPAEVDGIDVQLASLDDTGRVTADLRHRLADTLRVRNWMEFNQSAQAGFQMLKRVYSLVLVMLIGVAAFNLVATLIMVVMEKRKDIAVLMAMGATVRDVRLIFVLKGLIVGGVGTAAGLLVGALSCFALSHYHFVHIPKEVYGISTLPIETDPASFLWVAIASVALCLLATIYPARQASKALPVEVFRS